jgi:prolyl oligopeptidase
VLWLQVPLLDMQRYHKLLAGFSWMAEYGQFSVWPERVCASTTNRVSLFYT